MTVLVRALKEYQKVHNLPVSELARRLGCSRSHLTRVLNGDCGPGPKVMKGAVKIGLNIEALLLADEYSQK